MEQACSNIAIYNLKQANIFIREGCTVVGVKKRKVDNKVAIVFKVDDKFKEIMTKWQNYEYKI